MTYVAINLVSDMKYLYNENYKVFLKEYKKDLNK